MIFKVYFCLGNSVKAFQRGFRSTVSGDALSTLILFSLCHIPSLKEKSRWNSPQNQESSTYTSKHEISSFCILPHSSTWKERADQGSQEQTDASICHRAHELCSTIWSTPIECAHSHQQLLLTPVRAHLRFLQWCYLALILSWKRLDKQL